MIREDGQLVLDLGRAPSYAAEDFLIAECNEAAYAMVRRWPDWPDSVLLLLGPAGCGKSHLAAIWAAESGADYGLNDPAGGPSETRILEDCDRLRPDDHAFFHLLNRVRGSGGFLLLTAKTAPRCWGIATPDLLSRLRLATTVEFSGPDEHLIEAIIVKLIADRQIEISKDLVGFIARHCDRSLAFVRNVVAAVDDASLASGRRITRALASEMLAAMTKARAEDE